MKSNDAKTQSSYTVRYFGYSLHASASLLSIVIIWKQITILIYIFSNLKLAPRHSRYKNEAYYTVR